MRRTCVLALLLLASCGTPTTRPVAPATASSAPVTVKLIAFNDLHGHLEEPELPTVIPAAGGEPERKLSTGGVAWLAGAVHALRAQNPLSIVVASGDLIGASPLISALLKHESTITAMNDLGLEFSSVGNHEFDRGVAELQRLQSLAHFQYLAANVVKRSDGSRPFPAWAVRHLKLADGRTLSIAFIGAVLRATPNMVNAQDVRNEYEFRDEADSINAAVREIHAAGIGAIVLLIHQGGYTDPVRFDDLTCPGFNGAILGIVDKLDPAIRVVVSGHTHRTYVCRYDDRLVTSAGLDGRYLTDIDLQLDPVHDTVLGATAHQVPAINDRLPNPLAAEYATTVPDQQLLQRVAGWAKEVAPLASRPIGSVTGPLVRRLDDAGESVLGDLVADGQLAMTAAPEEGGAQLAIVNNGSMHADLAAAAGPVTYENSYAASPYGNNLVTMTLTGGQIDALLETQWQGGVSRLQVSGNVRYRWSASAPPGARIAPGDILLDGKPLVPDGLYRVTVTDFLANGGDNYAILKQGRERHAGPLDIDALDAYIEAHSPLAPPATGRVVKLP